MALTWDDFLKFAAVITSLENSIYYFDDTEIEVEEKDRRVAEATQTYQEFFLDAKYSDFIKEVGIS